MNKTLLQSIMQSSGVAVRSVDSVVAPIVNMGVQLRELSKAKADEAQRLRDQADELNQKAREADREADRAAGVAAQLEGLVL